MLSDENEISALLSSSHSYNQKDRDRLSAFFETPEVASEKLSKLVKSGT